MIGAVALITAILLAITAGLGLIVAVITLRRTSGKIEEFSSSLGSITVSVKEVHLMVNSQREAMVARLDQLTEALRLSNTEIPLAPGERIILEKEES